MTTTAQRPATYADLEALPETVVGESLFGALTTRAQPAPLDGTWARRLVDVLTKRCQIGFGGSGTWTFAVHPPLPIGPHVIVPDVAGWRQERVAAATASGWADITPDWVCETVNEKNARRQRGSRRNIYRQYGIRHLWHLSPDLRVLETFKLQPGGWLVHTFTDTEDVSAPPFDAITFSLGLLWPFDPPSDAPPSDPKS